MIFIPEPNFTRVIKSRKLRWAGHVACVQQKRKPFRILVDKKLMKSDHLQHIRVDVKIILKKISKKWNGKA
jgi:hypothetical protein